MAKSLTFTSIAVSGQACSGKSTLCKLLSNKLEWCYVEIGGEIRKLAIEHHLAIEHFGSIPDPQLRQVDEHIEQRISIETNTIWDGRLACYLARKATRIFKIYCIAPIELRSLRLSVREKISLENARAIIEKRDSEEEEVFRRLYALHSPYNEKWVNLKVDTSNPPDALLNSILNETHFAKT